jgi:hypothetical protein
VLLLSSTPALAQPQTTPILEPANAGQAPISSPSQPQPLGHAVGDAGSALGMLRFLPNAVPPAQFWRTRALKHPSRRLLVRQVRLRIGLRARQAHSRFERNIPISGPGGLSLPEGTNLASGFDPTKGLQALGDLLQGGGTTDASGTGSLLSLPNTLSSRFVVKLVDIPGSKNKAVESTSTLQTASVEILKGTPLELTIKVASQPTLKVTSTGVRRHQRSSTPLRF